MRNLGFDYFKTLNVCPGLLLKMSWKVLESPGMTWLKKRGNHVKVYVKIFMYAFKIDSVLEC